MEADERAVQATVHLHRRDDRHHHTEVTTGALSTALHTEATRAASREARTTASSAVALTPGLLHLVGENLTSIDTLSKSHPSPSSIDTINLHLNRIETADGIERFFRTSILNFSSNMLLSLAHVDRLKSLRVLDVSSNQLSDLEGIDHLPRLEKFMCSYNSIQSLRPLKKCRDDWPLQFLDIAANNIGFDELADAMQHLTAIREVVLTADFSIGRCSQNPVSMVPYYKQKLFAALPQLVVVDGAKNPSREMMLQPEKLQLQSTTKNPHQQRRGAFDSDIMTNTSSATAMDMTNPQQRLSLPDGMLAAMQQYQHQQGGGVGSSSTSPAVHHHGDRRKRISRGVMTDKATELLLGGKPPSSPPGIACSVQTETDPVVTELQKNNKHLREALEELQQDYGRLQRQSKKMTNENETLRDDEEKAARQAHTLKQESRDLRQENGVLAAQVTALKTELTRRADESVKAEKIQTEMNAAAAKEANETIFVLRRNVSSLRKQLDDASLNTEKMHRGFQERSQELQRRNEAFDQLRAEVQRERREHENLMSRLHTELREQLLQNTMLSRSATLMESAQAEKETICLEALDEFRGVHAWHQRTLDGFYHQHAKQMHAAWHNLQLETQQMRSVLHHQAVAASQRKSTSTQCDDRNAEHLSHDVSTETVRRGVLVDASTQHGGESPSSPCLDCEARATTEATLRGKLLALEEQLQGSIAAQERDALTIKNSHIEIENMQRTLGNLRDSMHFAETKHREEVESITDEANQVLAEKRKKIDDLSLEVEALVDKLRAVEQDLEETRQQLLVVPPPPPPPPPAEVNHDACKASFNSVVTALEAMKVHSTKQRDANTMLQQRVAELTNVCQAQTATVQELRQGLVVKCREAEQLGSMLHDTDHKLRRQSAALREITNAT